MCRPDTVLALARVLFAATAGSALRPPTAGLPKRSAAVADGTAADLSQPSNGGPDMGVL